MNPDETTKLGLTTKIEHKIRLRDMKPIQQKARPVSPKVFEVIHTEILDMLKKGVIEESQILKIIRKD